MVSMIFILVQTPSQILDDKLIKAHFNLRSQPFGIRDVVLETPGNDPVVLEHAFEIVEGIYADTWADVIAPPLVLTSKGIRVPDY